MKILKIVLLLALAIGALLVIIAPVGPLPGFFIGGERTAAPAVWMDTSNTDEIKLKISGTLPRVVVIWVVEHNDELHVVGGADSGWVAMLGTGGPVEMRLGDNTYALNAERVTQGLRAVLEAYINKYKADYPDIIAGFPTFEEGRDQFAVFKLSRS